MLEQRIISTSEDIDGTNEIKKTNARPFKKGSQIVIMTEGKLEPSSFSLHLAP